MKSLYDEQEWQCIYIYTWCVHTTEQSVQNKNPRYKYIIVIQRTTVRRCIVFMKHTTEKVTYSLAVLIPYHCTDLK